MHSYGLVLNNGMAIEYPSPMTFKELHAFLDDLKVTCGFLVVKDGEMLVNPDEITLVIHNSPNTISIPKTEGRIIDFNKLKGH